MLGESLHLTSEYLASEAKVESARSHASSLEAENSKLKKVLIATMNDANLAKEKLRNLIEELIVERELTKEKDEQLVAVRERAKALATKAIEGFQQTEEYNTVLFNWYFEGFKLLRRYFIKHSSGVDLESSIWRRLTRRWLLTRLLSLQLPRLMLPRSTVLQLMPEPAI